MKKDNFLAGQKLLIAEDDDNSFYLMEYLLNESGAEIIHTENGEDTIQALLENSDISLIIMDIRMPGMNGIETARKIREFNSAVPILAQSASMFIEEQNKVLEAGFNDYILKPIDQDLLIKKLKQLLNWVA